MQIISKPEQRTFGGLRIRVGVNIKMDIQETRYEAVDCGLRAVLGPAAASYNHGNKTTIFVKGGEFLDQLSNHKFLKQ
jgi:hypothetical protein